MEPFVANFRKLIKTFLYRINEVHKNFVWIRGSAVLRIVGRVEQIILFPSLLRTSKHVKITNHSVFFLLIWGNFLFTFSTIYINFYRDRQVILYMYLSIRFRYKFLLSRIVNRSRYILICNVVFCKVRFQRVLLVRITSRSSTELFTDLIAFHNSIARISLPQPVWNLETFSSTRSRS